MKEEELIAFFLSRSDMGELFLENFRDNREETNMRAENNYEFNNYKNEDFEEPDKEPGLDSHKMDFLKYESTEERLDKLKESLRKNSKIISSKSNIKEYYKNLTTELRRKIDSNNNKISKVNISYKDYTSFLRKYKSTADLNFTIPKPFEFLKRDYSSKKLQSHPFGALCFSTPLYSDFHDSWFIGPVAAPLCRSWESGLLPAFKISRQSKSIL